MAPTPLESSTCARRADDAPVIKLVHSIIAQAVEQGASDIHFEPRETRRACASPRPDAIDGVLTDVTTVPRRMVAGVVSRMKIMADLDIAERRVPQDGRVGLTIDGHHVDLRVVTIPTVHGEGVVMRILDKESSRPRARQARDGGRRARTLPARVHPGPRRRARHRADRLGQVDDALRARSASSSTRPR